ncbi:haloacid dehalogenase superfamily, subfamily IA, variant 3 with third motif having DD or ED [Paracoccus isoporae]|uniref:Haloacid dehalogenase superfamily, subfamily IA, variant 3 with third motif having DD or ED n=1 Tax=Paracoccus isoporae TaxID=591205 RepID=A0A1G6YUQ7_9RHOB|nr:HAD-IA family hydrolase [Paracoccus isoporae]SDD94254.1 haloacid dehalogenase superfamily, subfamily IA, variant 3 with third motif having DD or ED [Paracoccus isoporae]
MTAFIFDCDGVLIDSEPISVAELGRTLRWAGAEISNARIYERMIGRSVAEIVGIVAREQGADATVLLPEYRTRLAARFDAELRPIEGIAAALRALPAAPKAVASSSTPARLAHTLRLCGLQNDFAPHVYSAAQVAQGKPAPDLFLFVADRLGVVPRDCIVIEDSPAGIRAAQAAGMRVVAFLGGSHAGPAGLAGQVTPLNPDAVIAAASDLPDTLRRMMADA